MFASKVNQGVDMVRDCGGNMFMAVFQGQAARPQAQRHRAPGPESLQACLLKLSWVAYLGRHDAALGCPNTKSRAHLRAGAQDVSLTGLAAAHLFAALAVPSAGLSNFLHKLLSAAVVEEADILAQRYLGSLATTPRGGWHPKSLDHAVSFSTSGLAKKRLRRSALAGPAQGQLSKRPR